MFRFLYDLALLVVALVALPNILWHYVVSGKYRKNLKAKLGCQLPSFRSTSKPLIWIHAVSMGETRAIAPLFHALRSQYKEEAIFVISSTTETGHEEAKRSCKEADEYFFLPFDFSWIIRRIVKRLNPTILILSESDFWYHLLQLTKKQGATICLVNGKISERSTKRFKKCLFFSRRLFSCFDLFCVQSKLYSDRFLSIGISPSKIKVTGNLKFDVVVPHLSPLERDEFRQKLKIQETDRVLVIGSTHAPEEQEIFSCLDKVFEKIPSLKVLLVPRHPERFDEVAQELKKKNLVFAKYSEGVFTAVPIILIDAMGLLNHCYQLAELAIIGGSFVKHVGGHNLLEPLFFGVPALFGPYTWGQQEMAEMILKAKAGLQVDLTTLSATLIQLFEEKTFYQVFAQNSLKLTQSLPGATAKTFGEIKTFLPRLEEKD